MLLQKVSCHFKTIQHYFCFYFPASHDFLHVISTPQTFTSSEIPDTGKLQSYSFRSITFCLVGDEKFIAGSMLMISDSYCLLLALGVSPHLICSTLYQHPHSCDQAEHKFKASLQLACRIIQYWSKRKRFKFCKA